MISSDLGYILGAVVGDGFINDSSIGMNIKDKDFALSFKEAFEREFKKEGKLHFYNGLWRIIFHSVELVKSFRNFDTINLVNKGNKEVKGAFLRGFFDSEGSVYLRIIRGKGISSRRIEISNKNYELLSFCKNLLEGLEIKTREIEKRIRKERMLKNRILPVSEYFRFTLKEDKNNFLRFRNLVGFSINRKQEKLEAIINSYLTYRSKWGNLKNEVLEFRKNNRYTEVRKKFNFLPKSTINRWLYNY
jgi:intein-encoded DNA endonuclease-like protein